MFGKRSATVSSEPQIRVLYDGWPLAYESHSPAAIHLFELFEALPECVEPWVALPLKGDPTWDRSAGRRSEQKPISPIYSPAPDTPGGQLRWEQSILPRLARQVSARLIHTTSLRPPLFTPAPCVVSPTRPVNAEDEPGGISARLRDSLGRGGLAGARAIIWPADLPEASFPAPVYRLPPLVHSAFFEPNELVGLPFSGGYALAPGPLDDVGIDLLAAAWSWAAAGLGEESMLLAVNFSAAAVERLRSLCRAADIGGKIENASLDTPEQWAAAYQNALVVLAAGLVVPWGDALLQALASARPLAAQETPWADARVGPAGFLTPTGDARALGAAALTPLVEEPVAERLSQSARRWATNWKRETYAERLGEVYTSVIGK